MPNHITNVLKVSGSPEEVERFRVKVSSENPVILEAIKKSVIEKRDEYKGIVEGTIKSHYQIPYAQEQLDEYQKQIDEGTYTEVLIDFEGTVPMPEELKGSVSGSEQSKPEWQKKRSEELIKKYGFDDWYGWSINNWGTKWGAYGIEGSENNVDNIVYTFDTAWSCPSVWIETTSQMFPSLTFKDSFTDEGGGAGILTVCVNEDVYQEEEVSERDWALDNDTGAKEELEFITGGDYDEVIKRYLEQEYPEYEMLNEDLLSRIKDENLPLFMEYDWYGDDDKNFKERLRNAKNVVPTEQHTYVFRMGVWDSYSYSYPSPRTRTNY